MKKRGQASTATSFHPVSFLLQDLINLSNEVERELARNLGINLTDYRTLTMLATMGPTTVGGLAERIGATAATTTAILNRLEDRGFVARERVDGDRRRVLVSVTQSVFGEIMQLMGPVMTRTNAHVVALPPAEQATIEAFLTGANDMLREQLSDLSNRGQR